MSHCGKQIQKNTDIPRIPYRVSTDTKKKLSENPCHAAKAPPYHIPGSVLENKTNMHHLNARCRSSMFKKETSTDDAVLWKDSRLLSLKKPTHDASLLHPVFAIRIARKNEIKNRQRYSVIHLSGLFFFRNCFSNVRIWSSMVSAPFA
mgnify:FL=1